MGKKKTKRKNVAYSYFNWGPFLMYTQITPEECKSLIDGGAKSRLNPKNSMVNKLAGHLKEEYKLEDPQQYVKWMVFYFDAYYQGYNKWCRGGSLKPPFNLKSLWVNYMKPGDFNPPHDHGADLSFVIFPYVPEELKKENAEYKGTLQGPGGISWTYGEGGRQCINAVHQFPQSGDMYIFPASLRHWVFPFKSNVERISVSGNLIIDANKK
tara:strand:- start:4760 stop:5392 length:633 start_codon:yes stop_codon:yes gene_type:complete